MMQPPSDDLMMATDDPYATSSSQQQTQNTQPDSQPAPDVDGMDSHLWGFLQPCSSELKRLDFWKINPTYMIGRNETGNDIVLRGFKVSNKHCKVSWDGKANSETSSVLVQDTSSNGTWINGNRIGKGNVAILRDGNEIGFGTSQPQPGNPHEDYRYIFRYVAAGPPKTGLHAFYDIAHELGKGSFATVVRAVLRETGEWFAVKMIHKNKINRGDADPTRNTATTSFAREIAILEKLKHPNICGLKEVFFEANNINLVLELVEGGDLLEHIISRGGLGEEEAQHITYQICDALAYIHDKGIAHRDLKPENVLLTTDLPPMVKVADFGLAKVVDSLTMLRTMCGTPSYLAPEVVMQANQEGYDHVVDSWSVGVIVYSMLTNANPFIEDTNLDMRARIAERSIDWSCLHQVNVSHEARHFIQRLLEPTPSQRMTLKDALQHPWLRAYTPVYQNPVTSAAPINANDASMLSAISEGDIAYADEKMQLEHDSHAFHNGRIQANGNGMKREGSGLIRRSDVLTRAAEGEGPAVPQPSDEMLYAASQSDPAPAESGPSTRKRKLQPVDSAELWQLPKAGGSGEESENGKAGRSSPDDSLPSDLSDVPMDPPMSTRTSGRRPSTSKAKARASSTPATGRTTRARAAQAGVSEDDDDQPPAQRPRRSSRQTPKKMPRRS